MRWVNSTTIAATACLALGLVIGYSLPRSKEEHVGVAGITTKNRNISAERPAKPANPARHFTPDDSPPAQRRTAVAGEIRQSIPAAGDWNAREKWAQSISLGELESVLADLSADAGPGGLEYSDRSLIDDALWASWEKDSTALLAWLRKLPNGGTKRYLVSSLLEKLADNNPEQAFALATSFKKEDPDWNDAELHDQILTQQVTEAWKQPGVTADEMLELYGHFKENGMVSPDTYPLNFDFGRFLDGMATLYHEANDREVRGPADILKQWIKVDPQAAVQWKLNAQTESGHSPYFASWQFIAEGISATSGPQAYHQWAASVIASQPQKSGLLEEIVAWSSEGDLIGITEQIGNTALRDEVLATAVSNFSINRSGNEIETLAMISTPEKRLEVITQNFYLVNDWLDQGRIDPTFWPRVGLTTEQVEEAIKNLPQNRR